MKAGMKSSEFWMTIIVVAMLIIAKKLDIELSKEELLAIAGPVGLYTLGRSYAKGSSTKTPQT